MSVSRGLARGVFKAYHVVRGPHLPSCRYVPSCSEYAAEAIEVHGFFRGGLLSLKRLSRCHPWGGWGADPVPGPAHSKSH